MCNHYCNSFEKGMIQGIVNTCLKKNMTREEAVELVMNQLGYSVSDAGEEVAKYWKSLYGGRDKERT